MVKVLMMVTALVHVLITSMVSSDMAKAAARGERIAGLSLKKGLRNWADARFKSLAGLDIDLPMVKWSDDEPWKIEDLKKLEVVDEYEEA